MDVEIIDTPKQIADLTDSIVHIHSKWRYEPALYIDPEGVNLCREGSISILSLAIDVRTSRLSVNLIDVFALDSLAFETSGSQPKSLGQILEDTKMPKVFCDVRSDSDALFAHYGIAMQDVEDIQLMESATRVTTGSRRFLSGLNKCVGDRRGFLELFEGVDHSKWANAKDEGERLFKAERSGSYEVFNERPISKAVMEYCGGDCTMFARLVQNHQNGFKNHAYRLDDFGKGSGPTPRYRLAAS